jgi:subfamily B ATP-binding cassette protein MsbA
MIMGLILGTTLMGGISVSLLVPLVDRVLVKNTGIDFVMFEGLDTVSAEDKTGWKICEYQLKTKINQLVANRSRQNILVWIGFLLVLLLMIKALFMFCKEYAIEQITHKVIRELRNDLFQHLHSLSLSFFNKEHVGDMLTRLTNDTALVHDAITRGWAMMIFHCFNIGMYSVIALYLNWKLALLAFVMLPLFVWPIIHIGHKVRKISERSQKNFGRMMSIVQETLIGVKEVKAFCSESKEQMRFSEETRRFYQMTMKFVKRRVAISPLMEVAVGMSLAIFLVIGGKEVLAGEITVGQFVLFIVATLSLLQPFKRIGKAYTMIQQAMASADRVFAIFDQKSDIVECDSPVTKLSFQTNIVYQNVSMSYEGEESILENISFKVKKGQVVAFVGPSGGGKTSLMNLLPRFYNMTSGSICLDGVDIKGYSLHALRSQLGIVSQEVMVFHESVLENIAYGAKDIDVQRVKEVARLANADVFIQDLPEGYNTVIGERGSRLSGGQRQRLAIARALYKNPPILILDEATSALDVQTERLLKDALNHLMEGRTVLVVAHRLSTVQHADQILVIDKKKIVQSGTHEELLEDEGLYRKLYEMQFSRKVT